ncbi:MAG: DMT family transporter [Clostridiales bacterium]|nr:DMT family transporter [Clostridiales bacterium]
MERRLPAILAILLASFLWGTTGTAQALAPLGTSSLSVGGWRLLVGGGALWMWVLLRQEGTPLRKNELVPLLLGALMVALYQVTFFSGVRLAGVALGTITAIGSAPLWAGALAYLFRGERPGRLWYGAVLLGITGLLFLGGISPSRGTSLLGLTLALLAGLAYAFYSLFSQKLLETHASSFVMALLFGGGGLLLLPLTLSQPSSWILQPRGLLVLLHLGLLTTAVAYLFFAYGLQRLSLSTAVTLTLAEPLVASTLGILLLRERPDIYQLIGMVLLLLSLFLAGRQGVKEG